MLQERQTSQHVEENFEGKLGDTGMDRNMEVMYHDGWKQGWLDGYTDGWIDDSLPLTV